MSNESILPYSGLKWLNKKNNEFYLNSVEENSSIGYILEVDLEYSCELHNCIMITL